MIGQEAMTDHKENRTFLFFFFSITAKAAIKEEKEKVIRLTPERNTYEMRIKMIINHGP